MDELCAPPASPCAATWVPSGAEEKMPRSVAIIVTQVAVQVQFVIPKAKGWLRAGVSKLGFAINMGLANPGTARTASAVKAGNNVDNFMHFCFKFDSS